MLQNIKGQQRICRRDFLCSFWIIIHAVLNLSSDGNKMESRQGFRGFSNLSLAVIGTGVRWGSSPILSLPLNSVGFPFPYRSPLWGLNWGSVGVPLSICLSMTAGLGSIGFPSGHPLHGDGRWDCFQHRWISPEGSLVFTRVGNTHLEFA